jgi:integrase
VDRLDFLRRVVHVDRQLVTVTGHPSFLTAPKTAASVRTIPLPQVVLDALAAHLGAFPPLGDGFVFVTDARNPIRRTAFGDVWRAAVKAAGAPAGTGFHELRHFLCQLVDQARRERQDRASTTRSCLGVRDARYLLPLVARQ